MPTAADAHLQAGVSTALLTDQYELTMLDAALANGTASKTCTFEAYTRGLPEGVRYGIVAGTELAVDSVIRFRFTDEQLEWLAATHLVSNATLDYLAHYRFRGVIEARDEGDAFTAGSPVVTVTGTFAEAILLETVILSSLNHGCAIATAAQQFAEAANGKQLIEMGSRRTDSRAAVNAARAAWIGGFDATSNLEAGIRFGVPTAGTASHAWVLAHLDERVSFRSQLESQGVSTTLLVDTYDISGGVTNAVEAAQSLGAPGPGAIRIDSGELSQTVPAARSQLDELGATATKIVVSGELDVARIRQAEAAGLPIDSYGVGTRLVATEPLGFVYKLVQIRDAADGIDRSVAKRSAGKETIGGRKWAFFELDEDTGQIAGEVLTHDGRRPRLEGRAIRDANHTFLSYGEDRRRGTPAERTARARAACQQTVASLTELAGVLPLTFVGF